MSKFVECPKCGSNLDHGEVCDCKATRSLNGKPVFTEDAFRYETAKVGDYVEQAVVDNAMNCLPPACMRSDCSQVGEPYSHRQDPDTGRWRATYSTFRRVTDGPDGIWEYRGNCFLGENTERGKDPVYC